MDQLSTILLGPFHAYVSAQLIANLSDILCMNAIRRWSSNSATWKTREATKQDEKWDEWSGSSVLWQCIHSMDHGHQLSITATSDHRGVWDCAVCTVPDMIPKVCRLEQSGLGQNGHDWYMEWTNENEGLIMTAYPDPRSVLMRTVRLSSSGPLWKNWWDCVPTLIFIVWSFSLCLMHASRI